MYIYKYFLSCYYGALYPYDLGQSSVGSKNNQLTNYFQYGIVHNAFYYCKITLLRHIQQSHIMRFSYLTQNNNVSNYKFINIEP